jgi:hypothetical protein
MVYNIIKYDVAIFFRDAYLIFFINVNIKQTKNPVEFVTNDEL